MSSLITIARRRETPLGIAGVHGKLDVFDSLFYSFDMKGEAKELYLEADSDKDGCCRVRVRAEVEKTWIERIECTEAGRKMVSAIFRRRRKYQGDERGIFL